MHPLSEATRRATDIVISLAILAALAPLFLVVTLLIKSESRGPAFFRQERVGRGGSPFTIWKFRSMVVDKGPRTDHRTGREDARITRVGRLIRATSVDELPQLINVLMGHMTFVGPRPTLPYQAEQYGEYERRRLEVKPGITSLASISGRNRLSWGQRIALDVMYVDSRSVWLDLRIVLKTLWVAFVTREGVYADGEMNDDFVSSRSSRQQDGNAEAGDGA